MEGLYFERITTPSDIDQIKDWLSDIELMRMARMREEPLTEEDYEQYLNTLSYMIYVDGLAVGYGRIYKTEDPTEMEIGVVIANPDYRSKGLGVQITHKLMEAAKAIGATRIYWATSDYNLPSIKLAKKMGFKFYKCIPEVITVNHEKHDALVYRWEK